MFMYMYMYMYEHVNVKMQTVIAHDALELFLGHM